MDKATGQNIGGIYSTLEIDTAPFKNGLDSARRQADQFRAQMIRQTMNVPAAAPNPFMTGRGGAGGAGGVGGFGGFMLGAAQVALLYKAVKGMTDLAIASSKVQMDLVETRNKFDVVFSGMERQAQGMAKALQSSFNLSETSAKEMLATTGDILTGFGFSSEKALELSNSVARLAGDLASFKNIQGGAADAAMRLTKLMLGEGESAKMMGIVVRQDSQEFNDLVKEMMRTENVTETQAKALVALKMAMEQAKNAQGDFAKTQFTLANQMRTASEANTSFKESFGGLVNRALEATNAVGMYIDTVRGLTLMAREPSLSGLLSLFMGANSDTSDLDARIEAQFQKNLARNKKGTEIRRLSFQEEQKIAKENEKYAEKQRQQMKEIADLQLAIEKQRRDAQAAQLQGMDALNYRREEAVALFREARALQDWGMMKDGLEMQLTAEKQLYDVERERLALRKHYADMTKSVRDTQRMADVEQLSAQDKLIALMTMRTSLMSRIGKEGPERQMELLQQELQIRQQIQQTMMGIASSYGGDRSAGKAIQAGTKEAQEAISASRRSQWNPKAIEKYNQLTARYSEESAKALSEISKKLDIKTAGVK